ncbi:MAG: hypothetical protein LQ340_002302 [Diploschistes diacapsis]|nr:MAG: hypothetical protein LQ340_002302 [Diploschistes diacapsis]
MPITRPPHQPWHHSLTLDLLVHIFNKSLFHPFIASLVPLCLLAGGYPLSAPAIRNTIYYALLICTCSILHPLSERLAHGVPRPVDHDDEVIVISGGASGLGKCLAESYALKGASVAVLDIGGERVAEGEEKEEEEEEEGVDGVRYYTCDVADADAVGESWGRITKELGTPTVLVNCAGLVHGKRMVDMSDGEVERSYAVNTVSQYRLNRFFLDGVKRRAGGGTIVTVSSVLGKLGAARLSAYAATKAALTAYHYSLAAELRETLPKVKLILVAPGRLSTELFSGLEQGPVQRFFGPVVEVSDLAMKIIRMTSEGRGGIIAEPAYARWIGAMEVLPVGVQRILRDLTGVDKAMETFRGKGS